MAIDDKIAKIEEEIQNTPYNKATSHHIGKLKAKLARLKEESLKKSSKSGKGRGFHIKKSGDSTVVLVGFPSVGKSTILNWLTNAQSKIAEYEFTTLEIVPGVMEYKGAQIQIFDIPGIIKGASRGKGRGREILSVARNADLIVVVMDIFHPEQLNLVLEELKEVGIRPNQSISDVTIKPKKLGGIHLTSTIKLTKIDEKTIRSILNEYGIHSAEVLIRDDVSVDEFIDALDTSCRYIPLLLVINKIDLAEEKYLKKITQEFPEAILVAADKGYNMENLREEIFQKLELIRVYMKPQGEKVDREEPLIIRKGASVEDVARRLHRDFVRNFRHAKVWGDSVKFPGQKVGLDHILADEDVLRIIIRK